MNMTRSEIRVKYGIVMLEPPRVANKELTDEEAAAYEKFVQMSVKNFEEYWNDDDGSDDPD
jgi:hypothetical protein